MTPWEFYKGFFGITGVDVDVDDTITTNVTANLTDDVDVTLALTDLDFITSTGIYTYTGPVQIRIWTAITAGLYNALAYHDDFATDWFSRVDATNELRRCVPSEDDLAGQANRTLHAQETFAYTFLYLVKLFIPEWKEQVELYADLMGMTLNQCMSKDACSTDEPVGLAKHIYFEMKDIFKVDGWNADGIYGVGEPNAVPYKDWLKGDLELDVGGKCASEWKLMHELCESTANYADRVCWAPTIKNFENYLYEEKFYLSHVAEVGKSYHLGDEYICESRVDYPCYNMDLEAEIVVDVNSKLNDQTKARAEFFDNIWYWSHTITSEILMEKEGDLSEFEKIRLMTMTATAMYEGTLLTWKEKVRLGVIRPKTYINKEFESDVVIEADDIRGKAWDSFIPTPPTPEYPSNVACACAAYAYIMKKVARDTEYTYTIPAESSNIEEGVPSQDVDITFDTWEDFNIICMKSREQTGTHFSLSAEAGNQLCTEPGVGGRIYSRFLTLGDGRAPNYRPQDLYKMPEKKNRCCFRSDNQNDNWPGRIMDFAIKHKDLFDKL
eukprot:CAMPEP_0178964330 /NCGR_PEP_ID=MMETSP0789-20121207/15607_1 /TAXON_ID=3005 /ORGANISM="Rhizosolenia setigera, Strain CCMP 1694" /LENGTH=552 /DNA_ID=CAMNT_0020649073 /DNA_START=116 /DNA_END=1774 /DNA_ORIENTATION=+